MPSAQALVPTMLNGNAYTVMPIMFKISRWNDLKHIENPIELNSKVIVFPNPLTGNILNVNLDNDVAQGNYNIEIFNINGQVVYSNNMEINNSKLTIDLNNENLSKGFYTIRLQKNNLQIQAKFIVSE